MQARADNATAIEERLERAIRMELPYLPDCDYVISNGTLSQAVYELSAIIKLEREKRQLVGEA
jgi:guanylate kinase